MKGLKIGYIRVSSDDQNPERQLIGIELDKKYIEYASGGTIDRPQFKAMMEFIREGDTLIVHSLDRLARNLSDLRNIVLGLVEKKVEVQFLQENLIFNSNHNPMSLLLLSVMGAFAEFERKLIKERQKEGIALAKKRGAYKKVGRPKHLNKNQIEELLDMIKKGFNKSQIARHFKMSRSGVYKYLEIFADGMD